MKARDLMIGDWVNYDPNVFNDDEYLPIEPSERIKVERGEDIDLAEENCYSPIHLTEEILKANGFTHKDTMEEWWHEEYDATWGMRMSDFELTDEFNFGRAKITYVHQLQHALRLCGLNDLADNFKLE